MHMRHSIRIAAQMFHVTVSINSGYQIHEYVVGAYMYSSTNNWHNAKAVYSGSGTADIELGRDSHGKAYIMHSSTVITLAFVYTVLTRGYYTSVADTYDPWTIAITGATENSLTPSIMTTRDSGNSPQFTATIASADRSQHS